MFCSKSQLCQRYHRSKFKCYSVKYAEFFLHVESSFYQIISLTNDVQLSPYDVKTIDVKTVLDIFQTTEQAIVVTYQVNKQRKDNGYLLSDHVRLYSVVSISYLIM